MLPLTVKVTFGQLELPGLCTTTEPETVPLLDVSVHEFEYVSSQTLPKSWLEMSVADTGFGQI
jgi:hypothetical protein